MAIRRRDPPKVIRQEVFWVPESRLIVLPMKDETPDVPFKTAQHPYRVWTLYDLSGESRFGSPDHPPALPIVPIHNHGAFLEDYVHDWNVEFKKGVGHVLRYYSRVVDHSVWILCEYTS